MSTNIADVHLSRGTEDPSPDTPLESAILAYAALVPILAGTAAALFLHGHAMQLAIHATVIWAGAILCFLSGVRRGLSFRQPGGPLLTQLAGMLWLFVLGTASLLSPWPAAALALQMLGYATLAVIDPIAARRREAPRYFSRLRPLQMAIPVIALGAILAKLLLV